MDHLRNPILFDFEHFVDQEFLDIKRRGKYLFLIFSQYTIVCHFGMTGMLYVEKEIKNNKHIAFVLTDDNKNNLYYRDPRKFGLVAVILNKDLDIYLDDLKLGFEPLEKEFLDCDLKKLRSNRPIKDVLLDQSIIAGIGNIYASEILFRLNIHPLVPAKDLNNNQIKKLKQITHKLLTDAVALGGSTIKSYESPDGKIGNAQKLHKVYAKDGCTCPVCSTTIEKMMIKGRATFWCPNCQKR